MKKRIEKELRINEGRITEERLNIIAADFVDDSDPAMIDQLMTEREFEIEEMIEEMGGTIVR